MMLGALAGQLVTLYRMANEIDRPIAGEPWSMTEDNGASFINLAMLTEVKAKEARQHLSAVEPSQRLTSSVNSYDNTDTNRAELIYASKEPIELQDLFKPLVSDGGKIKTKICLKGGAGSGKSTLCQRIAFDWANAGAPSGAASTLSVNRDSSPFYFTNSQQQPYALVLWIKLRDLADYLSKIADSPVVRDPIDKKTFLPTCALALFIRQSLPRQVQREWQNVEQLADTLELEANAQQILYLLDGYDEIASLPRKLENGENNPVHLVLEKFLLVQPNFLVASRPYFNLPQLPGLTHTELRNIELLGFRREDVFTYVDRHFKDKQDNPGYSALKQLLQQNINVLGIAQIPVNLEILCALMTQEGRDSLPDLTQATITQLYQQLMVFLLRRYRQRNFPNEIITRESEELNEHTLLPWAEEKHGLLAVLGPLAFQGLTHRSLRFSAEELKDEVHKNHPIPSGLSSSDPLVEDADKKRGALYQRLINVGMLRGLSWDRGCHDLKGAGEFLHLTLQEFFAAWYIKHLWLSPDSQAQAIFLINNYKYHQTFAMVWPFVAGLLDGVNVTHSQKFFTLLQQPPDSLGIAEVLLCTKCLNESHQFSRTADARNVLEKMRKLFDFTLSSSSYYSREERRLLEAIAATLHSAQRIYAEISLEDLILKHLKLGKEENFRQALFTLSHIAIPSKAQRLEKTIIQQSLLYGGLSILSIAAKVLMILVEINPMLKSRVFSWFLEIQKIPQNNYVYLDLLASAYRIIEKEDDLVRAFQKAIECNVDWRYGSGSEEDDGFRHDAASNFSEIYDNIGKRLQYEERSNQAALLYVLAKKPEIYQQDIYKYAAIILRDKKQLDSFILKDTFYALAKIHLTREQKSSLVEDIRRQMKGAAKVEVVHRGLSLLNAWLLEDKNLFDLERILSSMRNKHFGASEASREEPFCLVGLCSALSATYLPQVWEYLDSGSDDKIRLALNVLADWKIQDEEIYQKLLSLQDSSNNALLIHLGITLLQINSSREEAIECIKKIWKKIDRSKPPYHFYLFFLLKFLYQNNKKKWFEHQEDFIELILKSLHYIAESPFLNNACITNILTDLHLSDARLVGPLLKSIKIISQVEFYEIGKVLSEIDLSSNLPLIATSSLGLLCASTLLRKTSLSSIIGFAINEPKPGTILLFHKLYSEGLFVNITHNDLVYIEDGQQQTKKIPRELQENLSTFLLQPHFIMHLIEDNSCPRWSDSKRLNITQRLLQMMLKILQYRDEKITDSGNISSLLSPDKPRTLAALSNIPQELPSLMEPLNQTLQQELLVTSTPTQSTNSLEITPIDYAQVIIFLKSKEDRLTSATPQTCAKYLSCLGYGDISKCVKPLLNSFRIFFEATTLADYTNFFAEMVIHLSKAYSLLRDSKSLQKMYNHLIFIKENQEDYSLKSTEFTNKMLENLLSALSSALASLESDRDSSCTLPTSDDDVSEQVFGEPIEKTTRHRALSSSVASSEMKSSSTELLSSSSSQGSPLLAEDLSALKPEVSVISASNAVGPISRENIAPIVIQQLTLQQGHIHVSHVDNLQTSMATMSIQETNLATINTVICSSKSEPAFTSNHPLINAKKDSQINRSENRIKPLQHNSKPWEGTHMKLPLKSMPDFIALSNHKHASSEGHKEAAILQFRSQVYAFFTKQNNPHSLWISELLILGASFLDDKKALEQLLNVYLKNIEETPILEPATLHGFADLLKIASQTEWLNTARIEQVFELLQRKSLLYKTDLDVEQSLQMVLVWQQLLLAMEMSQADIGPYKKAIEEVFKAQKNQFKKAGEYVGLLQVRLSEQALCRLKDKKGHSDWVKAAVCAGTMAVHLCEAAAMGAAGAATFGVAALGVVSPLLNAGEAAYEAGTHLIHGIKEARKKSNWYPQVKDLQAAYFASAFSADKRFSLTSLLQTLKELTPEQLEPLILPLSEALIEIGSALPGEAHKATHKVIFDTLKDWFTATKNTSLQSHILDSFLTIGRRLRLGDFIEFPLAVIKHRSQEYSAFPIAPSQVYNMAWLYGYCEESEANAILKQDEMIQQAIGNRLITQYSKSPTAVLRILSQLKANQSLDPVFIEGIEAVIKKQHLEKHKKPLDEAALKPNEADKLLSASLVLTVWYGINEPLQKEIIALSIDVGLIAPNQETSAISGPQFLFGHVKHMVIASLIERGAEQFIIPDDLSVDDRIKYVRAMRQDVREQMAKQPLDAQQEQAGLAAQVDFSFIGHYVKGVLYGGIPKEAIQVAQSIATDILNRMEKSDGKTVPMQPTPATPSFATLMTQQKDSPIHAGLIKQQQEQKENTSAWYKIEGTEDSWTLKIITRLLKKTQLELLQPIFQGFFDDNGDCDKDNTRRRKDNIFTEIGSYTKEALTELVESCNAALEKPLTVEEGAVAEAKTLPYPTYK